MRKSLVGALVSSVIAALVAASGCSGGSGECSDGIDNDGDGLIDTADPGCPVNGDSESPDPDLPACSDGVDNDSDGLIDFPDDPGCDGRDDDDERNQRLPACRDGIDNDGDGRIDYPNDPGCFTSLENDEGDDCPDGPNCPKCANGIDDDGDGLIDYGIASDSDPGCDRAADDDEFNPAQGSCGTAEVLPLPSDGFATGSAAANSGNELISQGCAGSGHETVYTINLTDKKAVYATTDFPETTLDTVLYVRGECRQPSTELGCNDDSNGLKSTLLVEATPGVWYIVVDAHDAGTSGDYKLQVILYVPEGGECDPTASECAPGLLCRYLDGNATTTTCEKPECSDGLDNDGDGVKDFPDDPGCDDADDNDEGSDDCAACPSCTACPACGNGTDDDGDTLVDWGEDPGCVSAADTSELDECIPGIEVQPLPDSGGSGTTSGSSYFNGSCWTSSYPEDVWSYRVTRPMRSITFSTIGSTLDTVTYIRYGNCGSAAAEIACSDPGAGGEAVPIADPALGNYYIFVDGAIGSGSYVLNVSGVIPGGEPCDPASSQFVCESGYRCATDTCVPTQCNDGVNNGDGDALIDYPLDPGCSSISDDDESDDCGACPACTSCPQCGNGSDDDGDSLIDYPDDLGCASAGDDVEENCPGENDPITVMTQGQYNGTTVGLTNDFQPSCNTLTSGPDAVYQLETTGKLKSLHVDTGGSALNTIVMVKAAECTTTDLGCDNDSFGAGDSLVTLTDLDPGLYFIIVDGYSAASGAYTLNVNAVLRLGQPCNPAAISSGLFSCETGSFCNGTVCAPTLCNNGIDDDSPADGLADFPADPGCASPDDNSEDDDCDQCPSCTACPACSNGVDDDGDSLVDYGEDAGCAFAGDDEESNCPEETTGVQNFTSSPQTGTTVGAINDFVPSCSSSSTSPDKVYGLDVPGDLTTVNFNTAGSGYDTVLMVKPTVCASPDLACDDDTTTTLQSEIVLGSLAAGYYLVIVDGFSTASGSYTLNISGTIASGQPCNPAQAFFSCGSATTCQDTGTGYKCQ